MPPLSTPEISRLGTFYYVKACPPKSTIMMVYMFLKVLNLMSGEYKMSPVSTVWLVLEFVMIDIFEMAPLSFLQEILT